MILYIEDADRNDADVARTLRAAADRHAAGSNPNLDLIRHFREAADWHEQQALKRRDPPTDRGTA